MWGTISHEIPVKVSASEAWKVYGTSEFAVTAVKRLPNLVQKLELVEGDGSVGTVLKIFFQPGVAPFPHYTEKITVLDNERRVKETEVIEGGYLNEGFTLYRLRLENIETGENCCITKCTIEYELKPESAANIGMVNIPFFVTVLDVIAKYLVEKQG